MYKKLCALLLSAAMILALFAGCGGSAAPAESQEPASAPSAAEEAPAQPETPEVPAEEPDEAPAEEVPAEPVEYQPRMTEASEQLLAEASEAAGAVPSAEMPADQKDDLWSFVEGEEYAAAMQEVRSELDSVMPGSEVQYDAQGRLLSSKGVTYDYPLDDGHEITAFAVNRGLTSNYVADYSELITFQLAETETNIHVTFTTVPGDAAETQMNLMFAGGDFTDVVSYFSNAYSGTPASAYENDLIVPLNDYLEDYSPNYKAWLDSNVSYSKSVTSDDGNIYGWYGLYAASTIEQGSWVRKDLIEKFGIEVPSTVSEMEDYFALCKEEGLSSVISCGAYGFGILNAAFDVPDLSSGSGFGIGLYHEGDAVKSTLLSDEFKTYMTKLSEWYAKGYYAPDMISYTSTDNTEINNLIYNGETGYMWNGSGHYANYVASAAVEGWDIEPTPNIVMNEGDTTHFRANEALKSNSGSIVLTTACEDIEAACRYVDWFYTDIGINTLNYGPEGLAWNWSEDGTARQFSSAIYQDQLYGLSAPAVWNMYNGSTSWMSVADALVNLYYGSSMVPIVCQKLWAENSDSEKYFDTTVLSLTADESTEAAGILSDLNTYLEENLTKFLIGDKDIEKDWDEFQDTVESMGLNDVVAIYQDAYDRYLTR